MDDDRTSKTSSKAASAVGSSHTEDGFSRRSILAAGTAALSGSILTAAPRQPLAAETANHTDSYSRRAYPVGEAPGEDRPMIARPATDLPPPIGPREASSVRVELRTVEIEGRLDQNTHTSYPFWTFDGKVPGPMLRVRVGDTVDVTLHNDAGSTMLHNVDFHAVTGPGGGAEATTAAPGETKRLRFKAIKPGLYVYHCAVPPVVMHMAHGMYGMILVEPAEGLPPVDREFYVMQGEVYCEEAFGTSGLLSPSYEKMIGERPEYCVFNGSVGALTTLYPMTAKVGETVRIFFGVGGPNHTSSLHLIGEIFDRVYALGALPASPMENVATLTVPAGGAAIAEVRFEVPGRYVLVDHALARVERGLRPGSTSRVVPMRTFLQLWTPCVERCAGTALGGNSPLVP